MFGHADRRGSALVEFAMLLPVLLTMIVGILCFGIYFGAAHAVQQLAADAARHSIAGESDREREALVAAFVRDSAASYFMIRPDMLREVSATSQDERMLRVRIAYDVSWLPIFSFAAIIPMPPSTITRDCVIAGAGA